MIEWKEPIAPDLVLLERVGFLEPEYSAANLETKWSLWSRARRSLSCLSVWSHHPTSITALNRRSDVV